MRELRHPRVPGRFVLRPPWNQIRGEAAEFGARGVAELRRSARAGRALAREVSWFGVPEDENLARSGEFSSTGAPGDDVRRPIRSKPETRSGMASRRMLCSDVEFATRKLRRVGTSPPKQSV